MAITLVDFKDIWYNSFITRNYHKTDNSTNNMSYDEVTREINKLKEKVPSCLIENSSTVPQFLEYLELKMDYRQKLGRKLEET